MSSFGNELSADKYVKQEISAALEQAAHSHLLKSSDELVDYLREKGDLSRSCKELILNASYSALRELLKEHQRKYHNHQQQRAGADQASSHGAAGPSVQRFGNQSDSAYFSSDRDPGSPMSESRESNLNVFLVPAAVPDADPIEVWAKVDIESDRNIVDFEIAKSLCGDRVKLGQGVLVGCRLARDDQDGSNTRQIRCVVGRLPDVNIALSRGFDLSKSHSDLPLDRGSSIRDQPEFREKFAENLVALADAQTRLELQNSRKRPSEDDDGGHRLARRPRNRE